MQIFKTNLSLLKAIPERKTNVGLVPTMGALHQGHLSLIEKAVAQNEWVIVSIFINPTQFDDPKDLENYPKTLHDDLKLLEPFASKLFLYVPKPEDLYGDEIIAKSYDFGLLDKVMEGQKRENHFNGVATVVEKLLQVIQPHKAYFGEKDFQQLTIVKSLVKQNKIPVQIETCPIVREPDGLAMSSRNALLAPEERRAAPVIYQMLLYSKMVFPKLKPDLINDTIRQGIEAFPFFKLDYFVIANADTLQPVDRYNPHHSYRAFIAVHSAKVRLIDTVKLE